MENLRKFELINWCKFWMKVNFTKWTRSFKIPFDYTFEKKIFFCSSVYQYIDLFPWPKHCKYLLKFTDHEPKKKAETKQKYKHKKHYHAFGAHVSCQTGVIIMLTAKKRTCFKLDTYLHFTTRLSWGPDKVNITNLPIREDNPKS
jgi:hypothetical protein